MVITFSSFFTVSCLLSNFCSSSISLRTAISSISLNCFMLSSLSFLSMYSIRSFFSLRICSLLSSSLSDCGELSSSRSFDTLNSSPFNFSIRSAFSSTDSCFIGVLAYLFLVAGSISTSKLSI